MKHRFGLLFLVAIPTSAMLMSRSSQNGEKTQLTAGLPWGFREWSYQMCKIGALDSLIPDGSKTEQCAMADYIKGMLSRSVTGSASIF